MEPAASNLRILAAAIAALSLSTACGAVEPEETLSELSTQDSSDLSSVLIARGSTWRYLDNGTNQGTAWRARTFDDSAWRSGAAPLGYNQPDLATTVRFGSNPDNKFVTTYFRRSFDVADAAAVTRLQLSLRRDDGAAVYLNGQQVLRVNLPTGALDYRTLASNTIGGDAELAFTNHSLPLTALQSGRNVLAVELHQASVKSSDIVFAAALSAEVTETVPTDPPVTTDPPTCVAASSYASPTTTGTIATSVIREASGLAASWKSPDVLFTHNDSGGNPEFYAIDTRANFLGTFRVTNATNRDWEDLAVGPCPAGTCVFIAAIGDNARARTSYSVWRVTEPDLAAGQRGGDVTGQEFVFKYPDGSHNAETLLVHPVTGEIWIVTKQGGSADVYELPADAVPGQLTTLVHVTRIDLLDSVLATGGSVHPCGDRFLLRAGGQNLEYRAAAGTGFASAFRASPVAVPKAAEPQGEAIAYKRDGSGFFTLSEGAFQPLHWMRAQ